jgi:iron complex transport system substrate-binding protein
MHCEDRILVAILASFLIIGMMGCATKQMGPGNEKSNYLSILDDAGRRVVLAKKPEKIVPLFQSLVDL